MVTQLFEILSVHRAFIVASDCSLEEKIREFLMLPLNPAAAEAAQDFLDNVGFEFIESVMF